MSTLRSNSAYLQRSRSGNLTNTEHAGGRRNAPPVGKTSVVSTRGSLSRYGSSSTIASGESYKSMTAKFRRKGSGLSNLSFVLDGKVDGLDGSSPTITMTDIFLSDTRAPMNENRHELQRQNTSTMLGPQQLLLPLPLALLAMMATQAEKRGQAQSHRGAKDVDTEAKAAEAIMESKLQDYFKTFASYPQGWDELEECRGRLQHFIATFNAQTGLLHHCGERLKNSAYVVTCPYKVALRSEPSIASAHVMTGEVLYPGQIVVVDSIVVYNEVNFLKLRGGGWAFERKNNISCMSYVACIEIGLWWYRVVSQEYAEVRRSPSFDERVRTGHVLCPGEVCVVALRCVVDERCWLHLADGRGWIFELRPPPPDEDYEPDGPMDPVMIECKQDHEEPGFAEEDLSTANTSAVEVGLWEYECMGRTLSVGATTAGWILKAGEKVLVDLRVPAHGRRSKETSISQDRTNVLDRIWLRLNDGRGWVPKTDVDGGALMKFVKMVNPVLAMSSAKATGGQAVAEDQRWMQGIA